MNRLRLLTRATLRTLAKRIGTSLRYLDHLAAGRRTPSVEMAIKIEVASRGAVPRESFDVACKGCKYLRECKKGK